MWQTFREVLFEKQAKYPQTFICGRWNGCAVKGRRMQNNFQRPKLLQDSRKSPTSPAWQGMADERDLPTEHVLGSHKMSRWPQPRFP